MTKLLTTPLPDEMQGKEEANEVVFARYTRFAAPAIALAGLVAGGLSTYHVAGAFGLSTATANNIVRAYEVRGWALTVALMVLSAGTGAAILSVIRSYIVRKSRAWLVA